MQPPAPSAWVDELGRSTGRERGRVEVEALLRRECARLGIERERLSGGGKGLEASRARYLVAALAVGRWAWGPRRSGRESGGGVTWWTGGCGTESS